MNRATLLKGDLVLLISDNLPRGHWRLTRVSRIVRSDDGRVRSAKVKAEANVYIRPVTKLCSLEEVSDP